MGCCCGSKQRKESIKTDLKDSSSKVQEISTQNNEQENENRQQQYLRQIENSIQQENENRQLQNQIHEEIEVSFIDDKHEINNQLQITNNQELMNYINKHITISNFVIQQEILGQVEQLIQIQCQEQNLQEDEDFKKLDYIEEKIIQAQLESLDVKEKDSILLIGATGVGKSTTINYFLNKDLKNSQYIFYNRKQQECNIDVIGFDEKGCLSQFPKIGHDPNESQTTKPQLYTLEEKDIEFNFCDTPGLNDNRGWECDFVNQTSITQFTRNFQSLKILILIGWKNLFSVENRNQYIKSIIDIYSKIFSKFIEYKDSFLFIFTHIESNTTFENVTERIKCCNTDGNDQQTKQLLDLIEEKLNSKDAILFNPLDKQKRIDILNKIMNLKSIQNRDLKDGINEKYSDKTRLEFEKLINKINEKIREYLNKQKFKEVTILLTKLKSLSNQLQFPYIQEQYEKAQQLIIYENEFVIFKDLLQIYFQDQTPFQIKFCQELKKQIRYSFWIQETRQNQHNYLSQNSKKIDFQELIVILRKELQQCLNRLQTNPNFQNISSTLTKLNSIYSDTTLKSLLINVHDESSIFTNLIHVQEFFQKNIYDEACSIIRLRLDKTVESLNQCLRYYEGHNKNQQDLFLLFDIIHQCKKFEIGKFLNFNSTNLYNTICEKFSNTCTSIKEMICQIKLPYKHISKDDQDIQKNQYQFISKIVQNQQLIANHFQNLSNLKKEIDSHFKNVSQQAREKILKINSVPELESIQKEIKQISDIHKKVASSFIDIETALNQRISLLIVHELQQIREKLLEMIRIVFDSCKILFIKNDLESINKLSMDIQKCQLEIQQTQYFKNHQEQGLDNSQFFNNNVIKEIYERINKEILIQQKQSKYEVVLVKCIFVKKIFRNRISIFSSIENDFDEEKKTNSSIIEILKNAVIQFKEQSNEIQLENEFNKSLQKYDLLISDLRQLDSVVCLIKENVLNDIEQTEIGYEQCERSIKQLYLEIKEKVIEKIKSKYNYDQEIPQRINPQTLNQLLDQFQASENYSFVQEAIGNRNIYRELRQKVNNKIQQINDEIMRLLSEKSFEQVKIRFSQYEDHLRQLQRHLDYIEESMIIKTLIEESEQNLIFSFVNLLQNNNFSDVLKSLQENEKNINIVNQMKKEFLRVFEFKKQRILISIREFEIGNLNEAKQGILKQELESFNEANLQLNGVFNNLIYINQEIHSQLENAFESRIKIIKESLQQFNFDKIVERIKSIQQIKENLKQYLNDNLQSEISHLQQYFTDQVKKFNDSINQKDLTQNNFQRQIEALKEVPQSYYDFWQHEWRKIVEKLKNLISKEAKDIIKRSFENSDYDQESIMNAFQSNCSRILVCLFESTQFINEFSTSLFQIYFQKKNQIEIIYQQNSIEEIKKLIDPFIEENSIYYPLLSQLMDKDISDINKLFVQNNIDEIIRISDKINRIVQCLQSVQKIYQKSGILIQEINSETQKRMEKIRFELNIKNFETKTSVCIENLINYLNLVNIVYKYDRNNVYVSIQQIAELSTSIIKEMKEKLYKFLKEYKDNEYNSYYNFFMSIEQIKYEVNFTPEKMIELTFYEILHQMIKAFSINEDKKSQFYQILKSRIKSSQDIEDQLIMSIQSDIDQNLQIQLQEKKYLESCQIIKKFCNFIQKIEHPLNYQIQNSFLRNIQNEYQSQYIKAFQQISQENFDDELQNFITNLQTIERNFNCLYPQTFYQLNYFNNIKNKLEEFLDKKQKELLEVQISENTCNEITDKLIFIRKASIKVSFIFEQVKQLIQSVINIKFSGLSLNHRNMFSHHLRNSAIGMQIMDENKKNFESFYNQLIEDTTKNQFKIEYINEHMEGINFIKDEFKIQYELYEKNFNVILSNWQNAKIQTQDILDQINKLTNQFKKDRTYLSLDNISWTAQQKVNLLEIFSALSAFWSVKNCSSKEEKFRKIHLVQVASIMRLLSLDTSKTNTKIENHLIQIKTGEGKSIVMGITACMFGLIGFHIDCCCYSLYLSQRDKQDFQNIFDDLDINDKISYNSIEKQIEKIIDDPQDYRSVGEQIFLKSFKKNQLQSNLKKEILLIDEVDYFFSHDFLNQSQPVAFKLNKPEIIEMFQFIWVNRNHTLENIKQQVFYKNLFVNNPSLLYWQQFIDQRIESILHDIKHLENHYYTVYQNEETKKMVIAYTSQEGVSYNTVKGYKTSFAYLHEWEKGIIDESTMNENLSLMINIGTFSFALMPKDYKLILGVSGTIDKMGKIQNEIIGKDYNISKFTFAPSIYGTQIEKEKKWIFNPDTDILIKSDEQSQFQCIANQANQVIKNGRTVIIFFENDFQIKRFEVCIKYLYYQIIDSKASNIQHKIILAGMKGVVTLAERAYGRGCDFICQDMAVDKQGGIHIIQTFLSEDLCEMIQIQGRTARLDKKGSYSLILNIKDLEKNFSLKESQDCSNPKELIAQLQENKMLENQVKLKDKLSESLEIHQNSIELKQYLINYKIENNKLILEKLLYLNKISDKRQNKIINSNYYSDYAGKINIIRENGIEYDENYNPKNVGLGKDHAFSDYSIIIGYFNTAEINIWKISKHQLYLR